MAQQGTSARKVRTGQDGGGFARNRQGQARQGQARRNVARQQAPNAGRQGQQVEANNGGQVGATAIWEIKCAELDMPNWTRRIGPIEAHRTARMVADAADHDAARLLAFGGKRVRMQLRLLGKPQILEFEVSGYPVYKYQANRIS